MLTGEKQREQEGTTVQVTNVKKKLNSEHYDRVDINTFLYTQREGTGTTKRKKGEDECDNVLVILCHYGTVKREKGKTNAKVSLLYYATWYCKERREKRRKRTQQCPC